MKPLIIHPSAAKDAQEIAKKYEEVSEALREQFWKEIDDAVDDIERYPERHHYDPSAGEGAISRSFHTIFCSRSALSVIGL